MTETDSLLEQLRRIDPARADDETEAGMRRQVKQRGRAALGSPAPVSSKRPGSARPRLALASVVAVAVGLAAALVFGGSADDPLSAVDEARAALPDSGEIVHLATVTTTSYDGAEYRYEEWGGDRRWRVARPDGTISPEVFSGPTSRAGISLSDEELDRLGLGEEIVGPVQEAYADGVLSLYVERANIVIRTRLGDPEEIATRAGPGEFPGGIYVGMAPIPFPGANTVDSIRQLLDDGDLRDAGTAERDGRTVRRLVNEDGSIGYEVDAETFEPVSATWNLGLAPESPTSTVIETVFEEYETLPLDEDTESLLEIDAPEGTPVTDVERD